MKRRNVSGLAGLIGLVLGLAILTPAATQAAVSPVSRTLAQGAGMGANSDPQVRGLQRILRAEGRSLGPAGVDGRFGPATAAAVRSFQQGFGLPADGIVGPKTRKLLRIDPQQEEQHTSRSRLVTTPGRFAGLPRRRQSPWRSSWQRLRTGAGGTFERPGPTPRRPGRSLPFAPRAVRDAG